MGVKEITRHLTKGESMNITIKTAVILSVILIVQYVAILPAAFAEKADEPKMLASKRI